MKYLKLALFSFALLFSYSCQEDYNYSAEEKKLSDFLNSDTFAGFDADYNAYTPDTNITKEIKDNYKLGEYKILIFVSPSCYTCAAQKNSLVKYFAYCAKVITSAGLPDSAFQIYSMRSASDDFPYKSKFSLNFLPTAMVMKDGEPIYSLFDSISTSGNREKFKADSTIERQILLSLKK